MHWDTHPALSFPALTVQMQTEAPGDAATAGCEQLVILIRIPSQDAGSHQYVHHAHVGTAPRRASSVLQRQTHALEQPTDESEQLHQL